MRATEIHHAGGGERHHGANGPRRIIIGARTRRCAPATAIAANEARMMRATDPVMRRPSHAQIRRAHSLVRLNYPAAVSGRRDPAGFEHVSAIGDGEGGTRILLDKKHRDPVPLKSANDF